MGRSLQVQCIAGQSLLARAARSYVHPARLPQHFMASVGLHLCQADILRCSTYLNSKVAILRLLALAAANFDNHNFFLLVSTSENFTKSHYGLKQRCCNGLQTRPGFAYRFNHARMSSHQRRGALHGPASKGASKMHRRLQNASKSTSNTAFDGYIV